jgi:hypothetical protein
MIEVFKFLNKISAIFYCTVWGLFFIAPCFGGDIYKWTDAQGVVHYSTSDDNKSAKPAELPPISRENISAKISKIKGDTPANCQSHGGVDCTQKADSDGSVICLDGFKDALLPYRFECLEAKIEVKQLFFITKDSESKSIAEVLDSEVSKPDSSISLTLRNAAGVKAEDIAVAFEPKKNGQKIQANGPTTLEPYGIGEYTLALKSIAPIGMRALKKLSPIISCRNCKVVIKAK